ncbi:ROK family protein [Mammaliicoccus vitulinus]|uniref:ROK family protein n=1 Tax=Mammaliicoccus vitulinus TaxID=71237 RepID=UPI0002DB68DD|nr:ROK family protein [Mammaliicoccus vitulinus]MEB7657239.1 ROK family protein [Mammaliicoccus vitulinus]WQK88442.1 ROK family protein [Mammaliicoccus vitulinus]
MKIAIDIGGTFIKSGVIDKSQSLHGYQKVKTPHNKNGGILQEVIRIIQDYKETFHLNNPDVGISTAGVVDSEKGEITYAGPTIPYYNGTNFKESLADIAGNVVINNDVSSALLGELLEYRTDVKSIFLMTIGTGIGGAYYEDKLLEGKQYRACEIGYLLYDEQTDKTYEDRGSTTALKALIQERYKEVVTVENLFDRAYEQDDKALKILNEWAKYVAEGIAQVQIMFDPEVILIGGGISKQEGKLISLIEPFIDNFLPEAYGHAKIETTSKGNDSALYGAVSTFFD